MRRPYVPTAAIRNFFRMEASGGIVLMFTALAAMIVANSAWSGHYDALLDLTFAVTLGGVGLEKPLVLWINDGLMAIFFLLVGMELKREILEGHLSTLRQATLPAFAAVGGMLAPALCYAALNLGDPAAMKGWAIPTATDIAFALGILALLGPRVPAALKAFLLSIAIFDDLGAILVIALFYTADLSLFSLVFAALAIAGLAVLNRSGVTRPAAYFLLGIPLWVALLKSGVHATLAGVVLAMFIPLRQPEGQSGHGLLYHLEHALHPWVAFLVLPVFAFANAGVTLANVQVADMLHSVPVGIIIGLFVGKQIGILGMSWLAVRLGMAERPVGVSWLQIYGVSMICGVGFTMSLFIASLAFEQGGGAVYLGLERLGILVGSLISGAAGYLVLRKALAPEPETA